MLRSGDMNLSQLDRLFLRNQYLVLKAVDPNNQDTYEKAIRILEDGYTLEYGKLVQSIDHPLSPEECQEVIDILQMFRFLGHSCGSKEKARETTFGGFDDLNERKQLAYARYLTEVEGGWEEHNVINSHCRMLAMYRRMLAAWQASANQYNLTEEDVARILGARPHPNV
jgi:uncharacterized protein